MEWITPFERWGEMKGLEKGRMEEAVTLLLRLFKRRFGLMRDEAETRVRTLPLTQLEELTEALLDFKEAADLTRWLDAHAADEDEQPTGAGAK